MINPNRTLNFANHRNYGPQNELFKFKCNDLLQKKHFGFICIDIEQGARHVRPPKAVVSDPRTISFFRRTSLTVMPAET